MSDVILRKYGVAAVINFDLFEVDGVNFRVNAVHASGDATIMKNEGAEANTTNGFVDEGKGYSLTLTATEMEAARVKIYLVDQTGTKVWLDKSITIETFGHPSAQFPYLFGPQVVAAGTADSGTTTTLVDAARTEATTDQFKHDQIHFTGGGNTGLNVGKTHTITGFTPGTDTISLSPAALEAITDETYEILSTNYGVIDSDAIDTMAAGIINGAAATGTLSTTTATTNLTGYADDQLIGRIITVLSGSAEGESSDITDYASTNGQITFTAMTTAMADGDTFKIT